MVTKATPATPTPRWLKHLRIGVITGILLGITGLISGASWLTWGFLYAPALSLTNKTFWLIVWKMLGAKDGQKSCDEPYKGELSGTGLAYNSRGEIVVDTDPDTYHGPNW